jgi:hypothetical protein
MGVKNVMTPCPPDEDFASRLRLLRLHQQMTKEQRTTLTEPEIASILFEVKRVASYGELARFAEEALQIPVSGTDSEYFPNAFVGERRVSPGAAALTRFPSLSGPRDAGAWHDCRSCQRNRVFFH